VVFIFSEDIWFRSDLVPNAGQALEPAISAQIMELHHSKHHAAYVAGLNTSLQSLTAAVEANDVAAQVALQEAIKFNGGGHILHSLFWKNLAPPSSSDTNVEAAPELLKEITHTWGSFDGFKKAFTAALLAIKGSGWGWLVREQFTGLRIATTKDQDTPPAGWLPILGVDMWEHAYYLQVSGKV
jgi:superoxide dismutase, Fe-Mn family